MDEILCPWLVSVVRTMSMILRVLPTSRHGRRMMASERVRAKYGLGLLADTLNPFWGGLFLGLLRSWNTCAVFPLYSWRHAAEADVRDACMYLCIHISRRRYSLARQNLPQAWASIGPVQSSPVLSSSSTKSAPHRPHQLLHTLPYLT